MSSTKSGGPVRSLTGELPVDRLKSELRSGLTVLGQRAAHNAAGRVTDMAGKLTHVADQGGLQGKVVGKAAQETAEGGSPAMGAIKGGFGGVKDKIAGWFGRGGKGGAGKGGKKGTRSTNIVEEIDVGVPVDVAYNQWTQFQEFSGFMKKVDSVEQQEDEKVKFKAQVFWSHRTWTGTILDQVPNDRIVWRSEGEKGHVDGAVTFHELAPNLTRILVVLEYYPQGLFERTGNLWRAQGRRARLELKHFRRHIMTEVIQHQDEVEGWRGEIHGGKVVRSHEDALAEEEPEESEDTEAEDEYDEDEEESEDEAEEEPEEESEEDEYEEAEDEYDEDEEAEDESDEESEEESEEDEYEEPEDEYDEDEDEYEESEDEEAEDEEAEDESDEELEDEAEDETADEYDEETDESTGRSR